MDAIRKLELAALAIATSFGVAAPLRAQNLREVPIGGRTATMGGAATAGGFDSAMPYLNPAGLARLPGDVFAVSASAYSYTRRAVDRLFHPNGFDPDRGTLAAHRFEVSSETTTHLPTSVMYVKDLGEAANRRHRSVIGFALVIPADRSLEMIGSSQASFVNSSQESETVTLGRRQTDTYFGPTLATPVTDDLVFGMSLFALYVDGFENLRSNWNGSQAGGATFFDSNTSRAQAWRALGVVPVLGLQLALSSHVRAGVAVAPPSIHVTGRATRNLFSFGSRIVPATGRASLDATTQEYDAPHEDGRPLRLNAGLEVRAGSVTLAADVVHHAARSEAIHTHGNARQRVIETAQLSRDFKQGFDVSKDIESSLGISLGAELALSSVFALRAGFFTDPAPTSLDPSAPTDLYRESEDRLGVSTGIGVSVGSFDSTIGFVWARHSGTILTSDFSDVANVRLVEVETTANTYTLVLSGAVTVDEARATIRENSPAPELVP